jgi:hypothetical protein
MRSIGFPELIVIFGVALSFLIPVVLILLGVRYLISRQAKAVASRSYNNCGHRIPRYRNLLPVMRTADRVGLSAAPR